MCGSCHFTHGHAKPVGGCSQATACVCVSMHDCVDEILKWSVTLWSAVWSPSPVFVSLNYVILSHFSHVVASFAATRCDDQVGELHFRLVTQLINYSCIMRRRFGADSFSKPQLCSVSVVTLLLGKIGCQRTQTSSAAFLWFLVMEVLQKRCRAKNKAMKESGLWDLHGFYL